MAEHPNATLFRDFDSRINSGDMSAIGDFVADEIEWHEIGRDEPLRGKDAVIARWTSGPLANFEFSGHTHDVIANDDHTIALVETTVRKGDKSLTYRTAEIMHIRDGKVTARWAFSDDTAAINAFFA